VAAAALKGRPAEQLQYCLSP